MTKRTTWLLLVALLVILNASPSLGAVFDINGTVKDTGGTGISGATVVNGSNTTTTNASGGFVLTGMNNNTDGYILTVSAAGYTQNATVRIIINGADNQSAHIVLTIITPAQSSVASSGVNNTAATVSWTVTATDNVDNNYVGNRVRYSTDSAMTNNIFTTGWSNTTTSPSFAILNLNLGTKYYYIADTYNTAGGAVVSSASGTFTMTHGKKVTAKPTPAPTPKATITKKKTITTMVTPSNRNQVFFLAIIAIIAGAAYYLLHTNSKTTKDKKKR